MVPISFVISGRGNDTNFVLSAMIDSGSPISLIKAGLLPSGAYARDSSQNYTYHGVNHSPLRILRIFEKDVNVNSVVMSIRFFVVPHETMSCAAILGRDYMLSPLIRITLGHQFKIEIVDSDSAGEETCNFVGQIMQSGCVDTPENVAVDLKVNPEIDLETASVVKEMFNDENIMSDNI